MVPWMFAAAALAADPVSAESWLVLGPVTSPIASFEEEAPGPDGTLPPSDTWPPVAGDEVNWPGHDEPLVWADATVPRRGLTLQASAPGDHAWMATTVQASRFTAASLELDSPAFAAVYLDGEPVASTPGLERGDDPVTADISLSPGDHVLLVHTAAPEEGPWRVQLGLEADHADAVEVTNDPTRRLGVDDLIDVPSIGSVVVSPDGTHVAIGLAQPSVPAAHRRWWTEVRRVADGALIRTLPHGDSLKWNHDGSRFAMTTTQGDSTVVWVGSLDEGLVAVRDDLERVTQVRWIASGDTLIFGATEEVEPDERGVKRVRSTSDRWPDFRAKQHLYALSIADGSVRQLTSGSLGVALHEVHPTQPSALISRTIHDTGQRPYRRVELYEMDLQTAEVTPLGTYEWLDGASYTHSPDWILLTGGPSLGDGIGKDDTPGLPNDYDTQLYRLDRANLVITPLTQDLDPSVQQAAFNGSGQLVVRAVDRSQGKLFRFDYTALSATDLQAPVDVVESMSVARNAPDVIAWHGSSATAPARVFVTVDGEHRPVLDPTATAYRNIALGDVESWSTTVSSGTEITGRVHLPPGFDPAATYPTIVYYYGGTFPTQRSFGGRYPKNLWTAHGYVVLVLQPSGAIGYGQEFSQRHVENWGRVTIDEIVEATDAFATEHAYVDNERIGCIGASYGGFTTMLLLTHTDRFAAGISHAGISSLSAYWGEGWWGHTYSAVASGDKVPWNDPDFYVDHSALFRADKITTPLLLLHGTTDMNVPLGESVSMYTALRSLGRDVEYIEFEGEGHWILDHPKRKLWMRTIVAYFDWKLKGQSEWWEALYGPVDSDGAEP